MTTSIPLAALESPSGDGWRRDGHGRYLMRPPNEAEPVGHTRVTTIAKILDYDGALTPWKATHAVFGAILRRGIRTRWEALLCEAGGNPWYAGDEGKRACKDLVEESAAAGWSTERRDTGTALHRMTAVLDAGRELPALTEETEKDLRVYHDGLAAAGITFLPDYIETGVVLDDHRVAGVFDRLAIVPDFPLPLVADLKTGADLSYSWHGFAVQLAAYANASATYRQGAAPDGSDDVRGPMPEVDRENGLIVWLPAGGGELELFLVDLTAGWEAFGHSMWTRAWRNRDVSMELTGCRGGFRRTDLVEALEASLAALAPPAPPIDVYPNAAPAERPDYLTEVRDWLQGRITVIGDIPPARADLGARWPDDLPTPLSGADLSWDQIDVTERLLSDVERRHKIPFPPPKPEPAEHVLDAFPNATIEETST